MRSTLLLTVAALTFGLIVELQAEVRQPGNSDVVCVRGKGTGETKESALKDAYCNAVENAVGLFVDAELMVDNDQLVKDKILTHSNAYIERYEEKKVVRHDGVVEVVIVAWVRRGDLTKKLNDIMPAVTLNVTELSKNLYAQIVTQDRRDADADELLKDIFDNFEPLAQLMDVSIVNADSPDVSTAKDSAGKKILSYQLKFKIDEEKYFGVWMPHLEKILSQISLSPGRSFRFWRMQGMNDLWKVMQDKRYSDKYRTEYFAYDKMYFMNAYLFNAVRIIYGDGCSFNGYGDFGLMQHIIACNLSRNDSTWDQWNGGNRPIRRWGTVPKMKTKSSVYVALVKRKTSGSCEGTLYELSESSAAIISSWMTNYSGLFETRNFENVAGRFTRYHFSFKDALGREIAGGDSRAYNHDLSNVGCVCWGDDRYSDCRNKPGDTIPYVVYITPLVGCFAEECSTWIDVEVGLDDIPKISTMSISPEVESESCDPKQGFKRLSQGVNSKPSSIRGRGLLSR